jgi:hypothetical protein
MVEIQIPIYFRTPKVASSRGHIIASHHEFDWRQTLPHCVDQRRHLEAFHCVSLLSSTWSSSLLQTLSTSLLLCRRRHQTDPSPASASNFSNPGGKARVQSPGHKRTTAWRQPHPQPHGRPCPGDLPQSLFCDLHRIYNTSRAHVIFVVLIMLCTHSTSTVMIP